MVSSQQIKNCRLVSIWIAETTGRQRKKCRCLLKAACIEQNSAPGNFIYVLRVDGTKNLSTLWRKTDAHFIILPVKRLFFLFSRYNGSVWGELPRTKPIVNTSHSLFNKELFESAFASRALTHYRVLLGVPEMEVIQILAEQHAIVPESPGIPLGVFVRLFNPKINSLTHGLYKLPHGLFSALKCND